MSRRRTGRKRKRKSDTGIKPARKKRKTRKRKTSVKREASTPYTKRVPELVLHKRVVLCTRLDKPRLERKHTALKRLRLKRAHPSWSEERLCRKSKVVIDFCAEYFNYLSPHLLLDFTLGGIIKGDPDVFITYKGIDYPRLNVELKTKDGTLRDSQIERLTYLRDEYGHVSIVLYLGTTKEECEDFFLETLDWCMGKTKSEIEKRFPLPESSNK